MMAQMKGRGDRKTAGRVTMSQPRLLLHLEGLTVLISAVVLYWQIGGSWLLFALLLLVPDLGMLGYLHSTRLGALTYNIVHTYALPAVLSITGVISGNALLLQIGLIWWAHIGMDRAVGYGLKYPDAFKDTHLGRV
jgi:hypothetical protein